MKRILVTGASRGIGRAIAEQLAEPDVRLFLQGRDQAALENTATVVQAKGAQTELLRSDLSRRDELFEMLKKLDSTPIDIFINNAGVGMVAPLEQVAIEDWDLTVAVNITAPFLLCQKLVPQMKPGASIVNILSGAAKIGFPGWTSYCMSKFALDGFAKALREELRPRGIRVINVYPGATGTDIWNQIPGDWPREKMMKTESVAMAVKAALEQPSNILVEDITLGIISGRL